MFEPLTIDQRSRYPDIIDQILAEAELDTITSQQVHERLERRLQNTFIEQKQALDDLVIERFNIFKSTATVRNGTAPAAANPDAVLAQQMQQSPVPNIPQYMAGSSAASAELLRRLPEEVYTLFVEHIAQETSNYSLIRPTFPILKALRLASRLFAYNKRLMTTLFRGVRLIATPEHLNHLQSADITKIAPYVQRLTFFPPLYSWALDYNGFREIVISQAIQRYVLDKKIWDGGESFTHEEGGYDMFIREQWNGKLPFSEAEFANGYKKHMDRANAGRKILESPQVRSTWVTALQTWSNCHQFRIDTQEYAGHGSSVPKVVDCEVYVHHHDPQHKQAICRISIGAMGDMLFEVVISCLSHARARPTQLDVKLTSSGKFSWESLPGWDKLDLRRLKKLIWRPEAQCLDEWGSLTRNEDEMDERARPTLESLLTKSHLSLEELIIERGSSLTWPRGYGVALPELRRLSMSSICVEMDNMSKWLACLPKLEYQEWRLTYGSGNWRVMFDAIRDHRNRMQLNWEQVTCVNYTDLSMHIHTSQESDEEEDKDPWMDICRSLANYLHGTGTWNKSLRMWFENYGPDEDENDDNND